MFLNIKGGKKKNMHLCIFFLLWANLLTFYEQTKKNNNLNLLLLFWNVLINIKFFFKFFLQRWHFFLKDINQKIMIFFLQNFSKCHRRTGMHLCKFCLLWAKLLIFYAQTKNINPYFLLLFCNVLIYIELIYFLFFNALSCTQKKSNDFLFVLEVCA